MSLTVSDSTPYLDSSLLSMELTMRHDARRAPMTFLYATESKLRSSTPSSSAGDALETSATLDMYSIISS